MEDIINLRQIVYLKNLRHLLGTCIIRFIAAAYVKLVKSVVTTNIFIDFYNSSNTTSFTLNSYEVIYK